jgi:hypothetical protein
VLLNKKIIGKTGEHISAVVNHNDQEIRLIDFGGKARWQNLAQGSLIDVAGMLEINEWQGNKSLQLRVRDVKE